LIDTFKTLEVKYAALNIRERWMVFFAGLAVIYAVFNILLLSPALEKQTFLQSEIVQSQQQVDEIQQKISALAQSPLEDANVHNRNKVEKLNTNIHAQKAQLAELDNKLVSPEHMPDLLKDLMRNYEGIRLVSMKTMSPEPFLNQLSQESGSKSSAHLDKNLPNIFKHGLELTFSGNYMELMRYAEALQALSAQVLWDHAEFKARDYPLSELTVTVYTLSSDVAWLSI
jgi:MSHA biogenesis protein MshJ